MSSFRLDDLGRGLLAFTVCSEVVVSVMQEGLGPNEKMYCRWIAWAHEWRELTITQLGIKH